jgi:hypothetical protein
MASLNLYIRDFDEPVFEKFKKFLEKEKSSMSEVIADLVKGYVEAKETEAAEPDDIELEWNGAKKIFKGHTLYWHEDTEGETGVFLTAKGKVAYWHINASAYEPEDEEQFEVYKDLDQLWEEQGWIESRMRSAIQREYVRLTDKPIVERLNI